MGVVEGDRVKVTMPEGMPQSLALIDGRVGTVRYTFEDQGKEAVTVMLDGEAEGDVDLLYVGEFIKIEEEHNA